MIMGDNLSRSLGQQTASKVMRSVKPGCIIDCVGRPASIKVDPASCISNTEGDESRDPSHGSSEACMEFAAVSVQIVSPRVMSSRGSALPLQLLATLTSPLSRIQGIQEGAVRLSLDSSILQRKNKQHAAPARLPKYECPLSEDNIIEVRVWCRLEQLSVSVVDM